MSFCLSGSDLEAAKRTRYVRQHGAEGPMWAV